MDFTPVWREVTLTGKRPRGPRPYIVSDFVGDREDALEEAARLAELLAAGMYACTFEPLPFNSELEPYDTLDVDHLEWWDTGGPRKEPYEVRYRWMLNGTLTGTLDEQGNHLSLDGSGLRLRSKRLPLNRYPGDRRHAPYVVMGG